ncbi:MAG TPA: hypothetical protein PK280_15450 [Planctomycetota bacterium]|nr:hypothetical protein [Planctomycetota bacterium]
MIGIVLLLAALSVAGVLGVVLVVLVRAKLREREELARASGEGEGQKGAPQPAAGAPRKPAFVPWVVVSGVLLVLATLIGGLLLRSCQAIGEDRARKNEKHVCRAAMDGLASWFFTDWESRKALPPAGDVPLGTYAARCPRGHRFRYLGGSEVLFGNERVLVVETGTHDFGDGDRKRHAIVADRKFLAAGKTGQEYEAAGQGNSSGGRGYSYYGEFFRVITLDEYDYGTIRQAVEEAP